MAWSCAEGSQLQALGLLGHVRGPSRLTLGVSQKLLDITAFIK